MPNVLKGIGAKYYYITFDGLMCLSIGGYVGIKYTRERKDTLLDTLNRQQIKYQNNTEFLTKILTYAVMPTSFYSAVQIINYLSDLIQKHLPLYYGLAVTVYLFLFGAFLGASVAIPYVNKRRAKQTEETKGNS